MAASSIVVVAVACGSGTLAVGDMSEEGMAPTEMAEAARVPRVGTVVGERSGASAKVAWGRCSEPNTS